MDWKLFASTFALIFLAELGDKTQLAAMAQVAAGGHGRWTVFLGASMALVFSTLIAVLVGGALAKYVPPHYVKLAAGGLFVTFGGLLLADAFRGEKPTVAKAEPAEPAGVLARAALELAAEFEQAAAADYRRLAGAAATAEVRDLLLGLAAEEEAHLAHVRGLDGSHGGEALGAERPAAVPALSATGGEALRREREMLAAAAAHEEATAEFYAALADKTKLPALRAVFARLAEEERGHARSLRAARGVEAAS